MDPIWFTGVCDGILDKLTGWYLNWHRGEPYMDELLQINYYEKEGSKPITTVRRVYIPWKDGELDHIIRIIKALKGEQDPKWGRLVAMLEKTKPMALKAKLLPGGARLVSMDFRLNDVKALVDVMTEAKTGKKQALSEQAEEKRKEGKGLWER